MPGVSIYNLKGASVGIFLTKKNSKKNSYVTFPVF